MNRSDNFNRADTTPSSTGLGTPSDGGSAWVVRSGSWGISGNKPVASFATYVMATLEASSADVTVEVTIADVTKATSSLMLWARASDASNAVLLFWYSGTVYLQRYQAAAATTLNSAAASFANGDKVALKCQGTTITAMKNGSTLFTTTSSFNQTVTAHGIGSYNQSSPFMDDLTITDLNSSGVASANPASILLGP